MAKSATEELKDKYNAAFATSASNDPAKTLWDSLSYGYGKKVENTKNQYGKSISDLQTALQKRGMGRSSYGAQTVAGMYGDLNKALGDIDSEMIADWQNRLTEMNEAEKARQFQTSEREAQQSWQSGENALNRQQEQEQFNKNYDLSKSQFEESKRQYEQNFGYQKERDTVSDTQWQKNFDESQRQYNQNFDYQKERDTAADEKWQQEFDYKKERDTVADEKDDRDYELQKSQADYSQTSDERSYYASWVQNAAELGNDVSDEILAKAGISRDDFNAMKKQAAATATAYGGSSKKKTDNDEGKDNGAVTDASFNAAIGGTDSVTINAASASDLANRWASNTAKKVTQETLVPKKKFA